MEIKDLIITPIYIILLSLIAYFIRPYVTTKETRKYFLPALWVRFFGAIMLGVIYQFYYGGGDTFNYFTHGSKWIWEAFLDDPILGLKFLLERGGERQADTFVYSQNIWFYRDIHSYTIVRISAFIGFFTFHTYSATALFFATISFSGLWSFYSVVVRKYKNARLLAIAILFVPTVVFWGSGILKDTITLGAIGWLTWSAFNILEYKRFGSKYIIAGLAAMYVIFSIKIYILACFVPTVFVWAYLLRVKGVKNPLIKVAIAPILLVLFGVLGYVSLNQITEGNSKYSIDTIAQQAAITAYDIRYGWGARTGGDGGYDLGVLDGSWQSMFRLFPQAVNVSLFRPYLWEAKNPLMLLSALEALITLFVTFGLFLKGRITYIFQDPFLLFCLIFAVLFGFAVGVSTYNFGTLMRYKIPTMVFYFIPIMITYSRKKASN